MAIVVIEGCSLRQDWQNICNLTQGVANNIGYMQKDNTTQWTNKVYWNDEQDICQFDMYDDMTCITIYCCSPFAS